MQGQKYAELKTKGKSYSKMSYPMDWICSELLGVLEDVNKHGYCDYKEDETWADSQVEDGWSLYWKVNTVSHFGSQRDEWTTLERNLKEYQEVENKQNMQQRQSVH